MGNIRDLTVKFGADTSGFKKGAAETRAELNSLNSDFYENKRAMKEVDTQIKTLEKQQKALAQTMKQVKTPEMTADYEKLTKQIGELNIKKARLKTEEQELKGKISATTGELKKQTTAADETSISLNKVGETLKKAAALTTTAVAGLFTYAAKMGLAADDINTLAAQTGMATDEIQKFQYASDLIDVSITDLTKANVRLIKNMETAKKGTGDAYLAFQALGVGVTETNGELRNSYEVFDEIIEKLTGMENVSQRDAYALNIFGKSAQALNPLLEGGAESLKELGDQAESLGLILSQEELDKLNAFNDKFDIFKSKLNAAAMVAAGDAVDAFDSLFDSTDTVCEVIKDLISGVSKATGFVIEYKDYVIAAAAAFVTFKTVMSVGNLIAALVTSIKSFTSATQAATTAQATLNAVSAANPLVLLASALAAVVAGCIAFSAATGNATNKVAELKQEAEELNNIITDAVTDAQAEINTLKDKGDMYEELRQKVNKTAEEKQTLLNLAKEIEAAYPGQINLIDDKTGAYKELGDQINTVCENLEREARMEATKETLTEQYKLLDKLRQEKEALEKEFAESANSSRSLPLKTLIDEEVPSWMLPVNIRRIVEQIREINEAEKTANDSIKNLNENYKQYLSSSSDASGDAANGVKRLDSEYKTLSTTLTDISGSFELANQIVDEFNSTGELTSGTLSAITEKYPELQSAVDDYNNGIITEADLLRQVEQAGQNLSEMINALQNRYTLLKTAEEQVNNEGRITVDTLNNIISTYPALKTKVEEYIAGLITEKQLLAELSDAYKTDEINFNNAVVAKIGSNRQFYDEMVNSNSTFINTLADKYGIDLGNFENYNQAKLAIGNAYLSSLVKNWSEFYDLENDKWLDYSSKIDDPNFNIKNVTAVQQAVGGRINQQTGQVEGGLKNLLDKLNSSVASYSNSYAPTYSGSSGKSSSGSTSKNTGSTSNNSNKTSTTTSKTAEKETKKELSVYEKALAAYKKLVDDKLAEIARLTEAEETAANKRIAAIDAEIDARKKLTEDTDIQKRIDAVKAELKYSQLDEFSRMELEKQLKSLEDEQAETLWQREKDAEKQAIESGLAAYKEQIAAQEAKIKASEAYANRLFTDLNNGYKSAESIVNNNSTNANITLVTTGLTAGQVEKKIKDQLGVVW